MKQCLDLSGSRGKIEIALGLALGVGWALQCLPLVGLSSRILNPNIFYIAISL
jgi:hypothetical protein